MLPRILDTNQRDLPQVANFYPGSNGVFPDIALQSMPLSQLHAICDWLDVLSAVFKEAGVKSQLQRINHIYNRILAFLPTHNIGTNRDGSQQVGKQIRESQEQTHQEH